MHRLGGVQEEDERVRPVGDGLHLLHQLFRHAPPLPVLPAAPLEAVDLQVSSRRVVVLPPEVEQARVEGHLPVHVGADGAGRLVHRRAARGLALQARVPPLVAEAHSGRHLLQPPAHSPFEVGMERADAAAEEMDHLGEEPRRHVAGDEVAPERAHAGVVQGLGGVEMGVAVAGPRAPSQDHLGGGELPRQIPVQLRVQRLLQHQVGKGIVHDIGGCGPVQDAVHPETLRACRTRRRTAGPSTARPIVASTWSSLSWRM